MDMVGELSFAIGRQAKIENHKLNISVAREWGRGTRFAQGQVLVNY